MNRDDVDAIQALARRVRHVAATAGLLATAELDGASSEIESALEGIAEQLQHVSAEIETAIDIADRRERAPVAA